MQLQHDTLHGRKVVEAREQVEAAAARAVHELRQRIRRAAPIAPHDGSTVGYWHYDEGGGNLALDGLGLYIGLGKAMNGVELTDPSEAPESVTYTVVELVGDSLTVRIDYGGGWWEYRLSREE